MQLFDADLRRRTVVAVDGQVVGQIDALCIDCETWRVTSLSLKLDKMIADQIGADRGVSLAGALSMPVSMVKSVGDRVVLSVPIEQLREVVPSPRAPQRLDQIGK